MALYPGCIQGFFLVYLLWQRKDDNREAIRYLNALLIVISLLMFFRVSYQPWFFKEFAEIILLPDAILFLTGPFIYLFVRALLRLESPPKSRIWWHFLPAIFHVLVLNTFLGLHLKGYLHFLERSALIWSFHFIEIGAMLSMGIYLACSLYLFQRYKETFYQKYTSPFVGQFLKAFILICIGLLVVWITGFLVKVINRQPDYTVYTFFWVAVVAVVYYLAYKIWSVPNILSLPRLAEEYEKMPDWPIDETALRALEAYMQREKPHLIPELKIGDLAEALQIPKHQLSRIINQGYHQNFFDFINGYRVKAFIQARNEKSASHLNTLELAFASGFNSKAAFNRAFIKETGMSPRAYFSESIEAQKSAS